MGATCGQKSAPAPSPPLPPSPPAPPTPTPSPTPTPPSVCTDTKHQDSVCKSDSYKSSIGGSADDCCASCAEDDKCVEWTHSCIQQTHAHWLCDCVLSSVRSTPLAPEVGATCGQ